MQTATPHTRIADQLGALFEPARVCLQSSQSRSWSSISFSGDRHAYLFEGAAPFTDGEAKRVAALVAQHDFSLDGAVVADARLDRAGPARLRVEALTVAAV